MSSVFGRTCFFGVLALGLLSPDFARSQNTSSHSSPEVILNSDEFYRELEDRARLFYVTHQEHLPHLSRGSWDRMSRQAVYRFKQSGLMVKSLANYAKPAAKTFIVANILSTFILPPLLTAAGLPGLAMFVLAAPMEPFIAAGQVFVMRSLDTWRLIREIGLDDYRAMKKLRLELLGMPERAHVLTLIESDILEDLKKEGGATWLSITRARSSVGNAVALSELEEVVRLASEGEAWLDELTPAKLSQQIYALELWFFVQERPALREELAMRLRGRVPSTGSQALVARQLHEMLDLRQALREAEDQLNKKIKDSFKASSSAEKQILRRLVDDVTRQANEVVRAADLAETHLLLSRSQGIPTLIEDLSSPIALLRERVKTFRSVGNSASLLSEDRLVNGASLRKALGFVEFSERAPRSCTQALRHLLAKFSY